MEKNYLLGKISRIMVLLPIFATIMVIQNGSSMASKSKSLQIEVKVEKMLMAQIACKSEFG